MEGVLAGLAFSTFIKDAIEVWGRIERSFSLVSQNRRSAQRLVREIGNDLNDLKDLYEDHHVTLDKSRKTETAIRILIDNMKQTLEMCSRLLPPVSARRFKKYTLKYYAWKNGSKIEEELRDMKNHVSECRQRFNTLAIARVEIQVIEQRQITGSRTNVIQSMLSDLTISANRLRAFDPHQSGISPSIVIDIPDEYLKIILRTLSNNLNAKWSLYSWVLRVPVERLKSVGSDDYLFPHDRDLLHRDAVAFALEIQRNFKSLSPGTAMCRFEILSIMVRRLGISREAKIFDWRKMCTRQINDIFRLKMRTSVDIDGEPVSKKAATLRHLNVLDQKVDLFFQFCEKHIDALDASAAVGNLRDCTYNDIYSYYDRYDYYGIISVETVQEDIQKLQRRAREIHELDRDLPLLNI